MKKNQNLILILILLSFTACTQVTIRLDKIPANTPKGAQIFVAGNFNFWDPGDERYIMDYDKNRGYSITLPVSFGNIEYKFTRGDWSTVERDRCGNDISNRQIIDFKDVEISNRIESWADLEPLECDSVTIILDKIPLNTPNNATIKIAGNFNAWNPANDSQYFFKKDDKAGNYYVVLKKKPGLLLKDFVYKIVRNDITQSESDKFGNEIETRKIELSGNDRVNVEVENWIDLAEPSLNSVSIVISNLPKTTPANSQIFLAGNFNDWNPGDKNYIFRKNSNGNYIIKIPRKKYGLSFKITRGNWESEAADKNGISLNNLDYNYSEIDTIFVFIENWKDIQPEWNKYYTFIIDKLPENTPAGQNIYLIGTYEAWASREPQTAFSRDKQGKLYLRLKKKVNNFEYKITRGTWQSQEYYEQSSRVAGTWDDTINIKIDKWSDLLEDANDFIRIEISQLPKNTPKQDNIFIAGGFNGWEPGNRDFILKKDKNGVHYIILPRNWLMQGFKFTRGSWSTVEGTTGGDFIENRFYSDKAKVLKIGILGWEG